MGERRWQTGRKVPTNLIRAAARSYKGGRPYISERASLYVRADAGIRVLFLWSNFGFAEITFRSEMERKNIFLSISLTYFVTLQLKTEKLGMNSKMDPMGRAIADYFIDSSDISYVFEGDMPDMDYYGEQSFQMQYKDTIGEPFPWLYIDADTLKQVAEVNGYAAEVIAEGEHYDYLARITKM